MLHFLIHPMEKIKVMSSLSFIQKLDYSKCFWVFQKMDVSSMIAKSEKSYFYFTFDILILRLSWNQRKEYNKHKVPCSSEKVLICNTWELSYLVQYESDSWNHTKTELVHEICHQNQLSGWSRPFVPKPDGCKCNFSGNWPEEAHNGRFLCANIKVNLYAHTQNDIGGGGEGAMCSF
jgi:hypothetical protein